MNNPKKCPMDLCRSDNLTAILPYVTYCNDCGCLFDEENYYESDQCDLYKILLFPPILPPIYILSYKDISKDLWSNPAKYGFLKIDSRHWIFYHLARNGYPFEKWQHLFEELTREKMILVRQENFALAQEIQSFVEGKQIVNDDDQDLDDIPF